MLQRPWRLEFGADSAHCAVEDEAVPVQLHALLTERDEEGDGAAEGLGVEKGRQRRRVACTEGGEEGNTVIDDGIDIRNVSDEAVGEAVALVVDGAGGEAGFGEIHGGELEEPAGLAGEAVDESQGPDGFGRRQWVPPLSEELETSRVGDVLGAVTH